MQTPVNINTVFAPLGMRLHFFEAKLHLLNDNEYDVPVNRHDYFHIAMIDQLGRDVNGYDSVEVYRLADEYVNRIIRILGGFKEQRKSIENVAAEKWKLWNDEIYEYLVHLSGMMDAREDIFIRSKTGLTNSLQSTSIQLPENYSIGLLQQYFKSEISHQTVTLLIYYMGKAGIMPPYEQKDYVKIAPIFGLHGKTLAKDFRYLNPSKKELLELKKAIDLLLAKIEEEIKVTRK